VEELLLEKEESKKSLLHFMNSADEAQQNLKKLLEESAKQKAENEDVVKLKQDLQQKLDQALS
jgi:hypothetical protein